MKIINRTIITSFLIGLSSLAHASTIDLTGNLNIEGFNDSNKQTYSLHLSNLSGNAILDSTPITSLDGTLVLDALGTVTTPTIVDPILSLINVGLNSLPSNLLGKPLDFSTGFGPNPITTTRDNIPPVSFGGLDILFDSIEVTATGNSIDFLFTESTLFGSAALILADTTIAQTLNNDSITSDFHLQSSVSAVPVPATVWLMGSGLLGLFGYSRKNQIKK